MEEDEEQLEHREMEMNVVNQEDHTRMAIRLISFLHHQDESRNKKRRWILRKWPEDLQKTKRKKPEFLIDKYVPESFLREESSSVLGINVLIQRSLNELYDVKESAKVDKQLNESSSEVQLHKIYNLSDVELLRSAPSFLGLLKLKALRALLSAMSGKCVSSKDRIYIVKQIKKYLAEMIDPFTEKLSEPLLNATSILKDSNSFRLNHAGGLDNRSKPFSQMPSTPFAAAHAAFEQLEKLPIRNLQAVHRMLMADCRMDVRLSFQGALHVHEFTLNLVMKQAKNLLSHVKEGDPLPERIERALHAVSLSARDLYGDDGGLRHLLQPLPPDLEALQDAFLSSLSHLKKMKVADLEKVYEVITGMPQKHHKKHPIVYKKQLRRILVDSLHCICTGSLPEHIARAIATINTVKERDFDSGKTMPESGSVKQEQIEKEIAREQRTWAELEAVLCVSASLRVMMWELSESLENNNLSISKEIKKENICASKEVTSHDFRSSMPIINDMGKGKQRDIDMEHTDCNLEIDGRHVSLQMAYLKSDDVGMVEEVQYNKFVERKLQQVEIEGMQRHMVSTNKQEFLEKVERVADEVAAIAYVLVGCVLEEMSRIGSQVLEYSTSLYLRTGLESFVSSEGKAHIQISSKNTGMLAFVIAIAEELLGLPKSVLDKVKLRLGVH